MSAAATTLPESRTTLATFAFTLRALSDPETMPRVLELFAKRGVVPHRFEGYRLPDGETLAIEVVAGGLQPAEARHIADCLRAMPTMIEATTDA